MTFASLTTRSPISYPGSYTSWTVPSGWSESTQGARHWLDLPAEAIKYVKRIEELIETPVALLSTSPERDDTILVTDPFRD